MYTIVAIQENGGIIEYWEFMKAFGDDLELAADWCYNVNLPNRCPLEFVIALIIQDNENEKKL